MDEPPRLSGQSLLDMRWAFEKQLGKERVAAAIERVAEPHRSAYREATPISWVAYDTVVAAHEQVAIEAGTTMEQLLEVAVPRAVERAFSTVYRVLVRFTSDEAIIARTPLIYSRSRSKGTMTSRILSPGVAMAEVTGWPGMPPRDVRALGLSIRTVLELSGRQAVSVIGERTSSGARYDVRWKA